MRKALNENPIAQVAIVGVLAIAVAFLLVTRVVAGGGSEEPAGTEPAAEPGAGVSAAIGESAAQVEAQLNSEEGAEAIGAARAALEAGDVEAAYGAIGGALVSGEFAPGPGLPKGVVEAYEDGKAVALLITRKAGIEDKRLRAMIAGIESVGDVVVFHAYARGIARFSRVTGGVDVSRVPALVVIRPHELTKAGVPMAAVSYGFRGPASAEQAVRDALYEGRRDLPYHPR